MGSSSRDYLSNHHQRHHRRHGHYGREEPRDRSSGNRVRGGERILYEAGDYDRSYDDEERDLFYPEDEEGSENIDDLYHESREPVRETGLLRDEDIFGDEEDDLFHGDDDHGYAHQGAERQLLNDHDRADPASDPSGSYPAATGATGLSGILEEVPGSRDLASDSLPVAALDTLGREREQSSGALDKDVISMKKKGRPLSIDSSESDFHGANLLSLADLDIDLDP